MMMNLDTWLMIITYAERICLTTRNILISGANNHLVKEGVYILTNLRICFGRPFCVNK